jgi:hypothetical protein
MLRDCFRREAVAAVEVFNSPALDEKQASAPGTRAAALRETH